MPQFVQGKICEGLTCFIASRSTVATSSGVSTLSLATSTAPTSTSLSPSRLISDIGTREPAHSSETPPMRLRASRGNVSSYWRHSLPRVFFQSVFALMP
jgi:hypothetical protein